MPDSFASGNSGITAVNLEDIDTITMLATFAVATGTIVMAAAINLVGV